MSNIVCLSQHAVPGTKGRTPDRPGDRKVPEVLKDLDSCIVKIAALQDAVRQALDTSQTILENLDNTIAAVPDPLQRSTLESKRMEAREVALANYSKVSQGLEFMAASACTIRDQIYAIADLEGCCPGKGKE